MLDLIKLMFSLAPSGIVNYHLLEAACQRLGRNWPDFEWHSQAIEVMGWGHATVSEDAMAHLRILAQQPGRFEQRTRGMSKEETDIEDNFVDSFESEDVQTPSRRLRKVEIDE